MIFPFELQIKLSVLLYPTYCLLLVDSFDLVFPLLQRGHNRRYQKDDVPLENVLFEVKMIEKG